jgi:hypothetical protein
MFSTFPWFSRGLRQLLAVQINFAARLAAARGWLQNVDAEMFKLMRSKKRKSELGVGSGARKRTRFMLKRTTEFGGDAKVVKRARGARV